LFYDFKQESTPPIASKPPQLISYIACSDILVRGLLTSY